MEQIGIGSLVVEVTRACNMCCDHCLRGDAQNMNMKNEFITTLLTQVESIETVTFTGGEPSLNVESIEFFLSEAKRLRVIIGSFYIATNGKAINEDFVMACIKLYAYSEDKEMCRVDVSNDMYHMAEGNYNTELLDGLSFFNRKFQEENYDYDLGRRTLNEGRAAEFICNGVENTVEEITTKDEFREADIYLNCEGDIINGCDWSYNNQPNYKLCKLGKISNYYSELNNE